MRNFSSYGSPDKNTDYYVPREALISNAIKQLNSGHYITVWAPRQTGKTWIMQEAISRIEQEGQFDVVLLSLQFLYEEKDADIVAQLLAQELIKQLNLDKLSINSLKDLHHLFKQGILTKPLILVLDEFDALDPEVIAKLVAVFRHIYMTRRNKTTAEKDYLLHGLALIGVRAALGVENVKGSPFNVQRSLHIPNLTHDEVIDLFDSYQQERQQVIEPEVVERIWYEFKGQPGLTCWFGELLTETYNQATDQAIKMTLFEGVYADALNLLPNNNILNIISKAKIEPYKSLVLELFQTQDKIKFTYRDPLINFLYMNGVVTVDQVSLGVTYVKFPCPYIQKQLFDYFARELYQGMNRLYDPFEDLSDTISTNGIDIRRLLQRYEQYLQANREMVLKDAPRRSKDLRVFEAVFQFHLYLYLVSFFNGYEVQVVPEFPTGNGAIDLLMRYAGQLFGLELKSFANQPGYRNALKQAAKYAKNLDVTEIWLVLFVEVVDDQNRQRFEMDYTDQHGVVVHPVFVQTGSLVE
ncbi:AAA-like domain-containing protein [Candidatus Marithrix sp. Canyon 246]|uniref:AAA-like domain-containing protein n=1 Tax=Candidatus Marithrix sp. Canyon 246 TaxID=1827136 RepID=UPI000849EDA4|nr:AAA-like domain-containing protein [Candidatus Marithrix sp. Canyon 246]